MKKLVIIYPLAIVFLVLSACHKPIFTPAFPNDPIGNFEAFWREFDEVYGLFLVKNIDWDSVYQVYRPQIHGQSTDEELYQVLVKMLEILNDGHTGIVPIGTDLPAYIGGYAGRIDTLHDFDLETLKTNYLQDIQETDDFMLYGFLTEDIGYVHIYGFSDGEKTFDEACATVLEEFKQTKGLVIDIRGGYGGEDIAGKTIASHFTDQKRLYMTNRIKSGPDKYDFTEPEEWFVEPRGEFQYTKPVILLGHRLTISARETFQLAMMSLPHVTTLGDTTAGAFSNNILRELPNGWAYSMSIGDWRAADGKSYEGIGIPPDILVQNKRADLLEGKDLVLEKAIEKLR